MKALVGTFNHEKALVGAFSVIAKPFVEPMEHYTALLVTSSGDDLLECQLGEEEAAEVHVKKESLHL